EEETPNGYFLEMGEDIVKNIKARQIVSPFKKGILSDIIAEVFNKYKISETSKMLDRMKDLGLYYSTSSGLIVGVADIIVLTEKEALLDQAQEKVEAGLRRFRRGLITDGERHERVISIWSDVKDVIQERLMDSLDKMNPIYMMSDSGARGNPSNFTQLAGMRGLMANPTGRSINLRSKSSCGAGISVLELFI